jgi:Flp pilus assembly protein TadG
MDAFGKLTKILKDRKGIAAVYIALIMFVLVAFVGLAIDIGYMYVAKGQLQNASDAAALAGASSLPKEPATKDITDDNYLSTARTQAWMFAFNNFVVPKIMTPREIL